MQEQYEKLSFKEKKRNYKKYVSIGRIVNVIKTLLLILLIIGIWFSEWFSEWLIN